MTKPLIWIVALSTAASMPSAAAACDLDGMPGFGGLHRMNPFAKIMPRPDAIERREQALPASGEAGTRDSDDREARDKRRARGEREREMPKREWETDFGNGTVSDADKATFT